MRHVARVPRPAVAARARRIAQDCADAVRFVLRQERARLQPLQQKQPGLQDADVQLVSDAHASASSIIENVSAASTDASVTTSGATTSAATAASDSASAPAGATASSNGDGTGDPYVEEEEREVARLLRLHQSALADAASAPGAGPDSVLLAAVAAARRALSAPTSASFGAGASAGASGVVDSATIAARAQARVAVRPAPAAQMLRPGLAAALLGRPGPRKGQRRGDHGDDGDGGSDDEEDDEDWLWGPDSEHSDSDTDSGSGGDNGQMVDGDNVDDFGFGGADAEDRAETEDDDSADSGAAQGSTARFGGLAGVASEATALWLPQQPNDDEAGDE